MTTRHWARRGVLLAIVTTLLALAMVSAPPALAKECEYNWKGLGVVCGHARNATSSTMKIASIGDGKTCTVRNQNGKVLSRTWKCNVREVGPGSVSPFLGHGQDVDAITFSRSFQVNEHEFKAGEWVKINAAVVCLNFKKSVPVPFRKDIELWNTQPRCYGK